MSFQGDVRGIGLAELLQGLARGRKEGVLVLSGEAGARARLGIREGKAHILPNSQEDEERWRDRVRDAWSSDPTARADHLRMGDVAHAERLENLSRLLDGASVHFRFEPREIDPSALAEDAGPSAVGLQVEFLLLEYARITDELESYPNSKEIPRNIIPLMMDPGLAQGVESSFIAELDGRSTLQELADRLSWPLRQARLAVAIGVQSGALRLAQGTELLILAVEELRERNFSRAAQRLVSWCRDSDPGPIDEQWAEILTHEWIAGRLPAALAGMPAKAVRTLLRRLDHTLRNPSVSVVHWTEAARLHTYDVASRMHRLMAEYREDERGDRPDIRELLELARDLRDAGYPWRMGPALQVAAAKNPEGLSQQLELGLGLIEAGRYDEATRWVHAAARDMINRGQSDRAVTPLRMLLEVSPRDREARALLSRAKRTSQSVKKLRKHLMISGAFIVALGSGAMVVVHKQNVRDQRIAEISSQMEDPQLAKATLLRYFPSDPPVDVIELGARIDAMQREADLDLKSAWMGRYQAAHQLAVSGAPLDALAATRAMEDPPRLVILRESWPKIPELYSLVGNRFVEMVENLPPPRAGAEDQVERELALEDLGRAIEASLSEDELYLSEVQSLLDSLAIGRELIKERANERKQLLDRQILNENLSQLSAKLTEARAADQRYAFAQAIKLYTEIVNESPTGAVKELVQPELTAVESKHATELQARELAKSGEHAAAIELLYASFDEPERFILPWTFTTFPAGASARSSEGREYTTPFTIETAVDKELRFEIVAPGYLESVVTVHGPGDQFLWMDRTPERAWSAGARIDAVPVAYRGDHVMVDRDGNMVRVGPDNVRHWSRSISTLSGVARAPVFLPNLDGKLLMVTEDGAAWMLSAETGKVEGPWELGIPPHVGPTPFDNQVRVRLADGRSASWQEGLKPTIESAAARDPLSDKDTAYRYGSDCGMQVARKRAGHEGVLESRFGDWRAEVRPDVVFVQPGEDPTAGFSIRRTGEWCFMAWEPATQGAPRGRFWLSDGAGLRAYQLPAQ